MNPPTSWTQDELRDPHQQADKAQKVRAMFAAIAPSYDLNNRLHALGRDQAWRRAAVQLAKVQPGDVVLDVACGTGDLSLAFTRTQARQVIGVDFTVPMLNIAQHKAEHAKQAVPFAGGDAMGLPLSSESVDVVSIAFGIRNVAQPARALSEFYRVLRPGGRVVVLEFSLPTNRLLRSGYLFYFNHVLPRSAGWIAGDKTGAYRYLPRSVNTFLGRQQMVELMQQAGFGQVTLHPLPLGVAVVYVGVKQ